MLIPAIIFAAIIITIVLYIICAGTREDYADDIEQSEYLRQWYEKHKKEI